MESPETAVAVSGLFVGFSQGRALGEHPQSALRAAISLPRKEPFKTQQQKQHCNAIGNFKLHKRKNRLVVFCDFLH